MLESNHTSPGQVEAKLLASKLYRITREDALTRIPKTLSAAERTSASDRISNALSNHLLPYMEESEIIASQLETPEYQLFTREVSDYLGAEVGRVKCPDGRIGEIALVDPGVVRSYRKLQGLITTREGRDGTQVIVDPQFVGRIRKIFRERVKEGKSPKLVELLGTHIHSAKPDHGCGACMAKLDDIGISREVGMHFGGIDLYFDWLGEGFEAFNNNARIAGFEAETFDFVHDAYSQGFIVGLRNEYRNFNPDLSLRINLLNLAKEGKILMTELLDSQFSSMVIEATQRLGISLSLDIGDHRKIAENVMKIGKVALDITREQEKEGFTFIPDAVKQGKSETAIRVLAYHAIRNVVYRILGNITAGDHEHEKHQESLIRVGPVGPDTISNIAFSYNVNGELPEEGGEALDDIKKLYGILYGVYKDRTIDVRKEGRVILVVGEYDELTDKEREDTIDSLIEHNAHVIRDGLPGGIRTGDLVVAALRYNPRTRKFSAISKPIS